VCTRTQPRDQWGAAAEYLSSALGGPGGAPPGAICTPGGSGPPPPAPMVGMGPATAPAESSSPAAAVVYRSSAPDAIAVPSSDLKAAVEDEEREGEEEQSPPLLENFAGSAPLIGHFLHGGTRKTAAASRRYSSYSEPGGKPSSMRCVAVTLGWRGSSSAGRGSDTLTPRYRDEASSEQLGPVLRATSTVPSRASVSYVSENGEGSCLGASPPQEWKLAVNCSTAAAAPQSQRNDSRGGGVACSS
jgi:hypothetical protein